MTRKLLGLLGILAILVTMTAAASAQTVDTLVFDFGGLLDPPISVDVDSQKLPHSAVLQLSGDLTPEAANPVFACRGSNSVPARYGHQRHTVHTDSTTTDSSAEGSGSILVISHVGLPGPFPDPGPITASLPT